MDHVKIPKISCIYSASGLPTGKIHAAPQIWIYPLLEPMKVIFNVYLYLLLSLHLFTSLTFYRWPNTFIFLHLILQVAQTKAEHDNVVESLEDDEIKTTKADKEDTTKLCVHNICGNSFMHKEGLFDHVSNIHSCNI